MKVKENKSLFLKQFGDTPQLRVIDFFLDNQMFDFPLTEIAREVEGLKKFRNETIREIHEIKLNCTKNHK